MHFNVPDYSIVLTRKDTNYSYDELYLNERRIAIKSHTETIEEDEITKKWQSFAKNIASNKHWEIE